MNLLERHALSNRSEDLDSAILHFTKSILLPPLLWLQHNSFILSTLFQLARALLLRSAVTKQHEDVVSATKFLFHLRHQPHEIPTIPRHRVTELFVHTLALQVALDAGNVMQNIRVMAVLSRELLTIGTSDIDTTRLINFIWEVVASKIYLGVPDQPLDELIECLRVAIKRRPDLHHGRAAFTKSLACRYYMTCMDTDYEEAVSILDEIATSGYSQDKSVAAFQMHATAVAVQLAMFRSDVHESPESLEEAIYRTRACHSSDSEVLAEKRIRYFGSIEGVEEPSLSQLAAESDEMASLASLSLVILNDGDTTKIDEAIKKGRSIVASSHMTHVHNKFGMILRDAFDRTKKIEYLNESIRRIRQLLESPTFPQAERFGTLLSLSHSLLTRCQHFPNYRTQDLDETLELFPQYVNNARASLPNRLLLARVWALLSRLTRHPSVSTTYETALSLMQDTLLFSPTLQLQHTTLATMDKTLGLPLDYASYRVDLNQLEEAIEILERASRTLVRDASTPCFN